MKSRTKLRNLIEQESIAYMPGAHDALSVKIATEYPHVDGIQHSGYGTAASLLGYPDMNFTSLAETVAVVRNMVRTANDIPIVVDGDTGYGGVANLNHTIGEIENAGAAGIFIEDQDTPKQCGLMKGKETIETKKMCNKIKAALDFRTDDEFAVMARTDAYEEYGINEIIERGERYAEAGADVFLVGDPISMDEIKNITNSINIPFYALGVHPEGFDLDSKEPLKDYEAAGASLISDVGGLLQVSVSAMEAYIRSMDDGTADSIDPRPLDQLSSFLGEKKYSDFEERYT